MRWFILARAYHYKLPLKNMENIANIFNSTAFPIACVIVCIYFIKYILKGYLSYLQDTNKRMIEVISKNTDLLQKIYDYLTKT